MKPEEKKTALLNFLDNGGAFVSGNELARRLDVSRMSVWKYIQALKEDGFEIEAVTNRGYRLSDDNDVLTCDKVKTALGSQASRFPLEVRDCCDSTNLVIRQNAGALPEWYTLIAQCQTAGRGRQGRPFYSPPKTGLYMSVLLRPQKKAEDAVFLTTAAAVAVCRAIEEVTDLSARIKWVNDICVHDKKVCGILTEASLDMESRSVEYAVLGIGINVARPKDGFPESIRDTAGAVLSHPRCGTRSRLAAAILRHLSLLYADPNPWRFAAEYRRRSLLIGQKITVLRPEGNRSAVAVDIDDRCRLLVRYEDGSLESLSGGEVSIRQTA